MTATGSPTPRLRLILRGDKSRQVLQQQVYVTYNTGQVNEHSRWVWMDVPLGIETADEARARLEAEAVKDFIMATNQIIK